ncbi:hypothetical protein [uncultured Sphingomonas sp.]|uniref:hypothetical protein n=1 Tax=uncultured Sphingomonas sp. TaxID=158754 RepID=UPI00374958AB
MTDRHRRDLAACARILAARRGVAQGHHATAAAAEAVASQAVAEAQEAIDDRAAAWRAQLAGGFDPIIGSALAADLIVATARMEKAVDDHAEAVATRCRAVQAWRAEDARCRIATTIVARADRSRARRRDERSADAATDRTTFLWSRS